jgi:hypothetical protein
VKTRSKFSVYKHFDFKGKGAMVRNRQESKRVMQKDRWKRRRDSKRNGRAEVRENEIAKERQNRVTEKESGHTFVYFQASSLTSN